MSQPTIDVSIQRLAGNEDLLLPDYQTDHAAAMDIHAAVIEPMVLEPGDIKLIPAGFAIALPTGYEAQIRPRSGLALKFGITMINAPGTIDADYRGQVQIPLINLGKQSFTVTRGMRVAQMLITPVPRTVWREVEALPTSTRGEGGFGHTGH